jgi:hypothetical protein
MLKKLSLMIVLAAGITVTGSSPKAAVKLPPLNPAPKKAVFALTNTCNWVVVNGKRVNLFDYEVDGVVNYVTWRRFEPQEGKFRYPGLDRMLREAAKANKYLSYNILAGMHAPDWVYEKTGQKPFIYSQPNGIKRKTYLPWITVNGKRVLNVPFLKIWKNTIINFSQYIYNHPHRDRISYVAITGWPTTNGLELMFPIKYNELQQIKWDTEAKQLYIEFCKKCIDIFIEAFPDFPLGIAYTDWFGCNKNGSPHRSTAEVDAIMDYAIKRAKQKGISLIPMGLWLAHQNIVTNQEHPLTQQMKKFQKQTIGIALEGPMGTYKNKKYMPFDMQLEAARQIGCSWVQFWHYDIIHGPYQETLKKYRKIFRDRK